MMSPKVKELLEEKQLTYEQLRQSIYAHDRVEFAKAAGITPDPWQCDVLRSKAKRILLLCSRQAGKSTITAVRALHKALYEPGSFVLVFGPSQDQSVEFFRKVAQFYDGLHGAKSDAQRMMRMGMELSNGSRIEARPGSAKTARGRTADLLIIDEAAEIEDELYVALRPMLAVSGGDLMMLSTPKGKRGVFYEAWSNGLRWERYRVTADECPRITKEFLEEERLSMTDRQFKQEYFCSFEETEDSAFDSRAIEQAYTDDFELFLSA